MAWMYGKPVMLTKYGMEGTAPDGTARPGADLDFMVLFDPAGAGCDNLGYCNPGADIVWSATGHPDLQYIGLQYSERCGNCATMGYFAPQSGSITVSAKSLNTISWTIPVSSTDTEAGVAIIEDVLCGDSPDYACDCESGILKIWYTVDKSIYGNGMAYVDILIDGNVIASDVVVSLQSRGRMSYSTPCPSRTVAHTITVRAVGGNSESITLPAKSGGGGGVVVPVEGSTKCVGSNGQIYTGGMWVNDSTINCGGGGNGDIIINPPGTDGGGSDIMGTLTNFYENNKLVSIGGIVIIGAVLLLGGSK